MYTSLVGYPLYIPFCHIQQYIAPSLVVYLPYIHLIGRLSLIYPLLPHSTVYSPFSGGISPIYTPHWSVIPYIHLLPHSTVYSPFSGGISPIYNTSLVGYPLYTPSATFNVIVGTITTGIHYHIALIFHGSKFSRIAVLKEFVEKISQMCVAHVPDSTVAQILAE